MSCDARVKWLRVFEAAVISLDNVSKRYGDQEALALIVQAAFDRLEKSVVPAGLRIRQAD